jgi:hypothetical protein
MLTSPPEEEEPEERAVLVRLKEYSVILADHT